MRISEGQLRQIIREELNENLQGFLTRTADISYDGDSDADPTFESDPEMRSDARGIKRSWAAEADHQFMESVTKIHWMKNLSRQNIQRMLDGGRDEISTMGYVRGPYNSGPAGEDAWGGYGLVIQGRTTLAANDMDDIFSGYHKDISQDVREKYRSSGLRKRAMGFNKRKAEGYILDKASFDRFGQGENEFIVAGWKVVAVVLTERQFQNIQGAFIGGDFPWQIREWTESFETIRDLGIPYLKREQKNLAKEWLAKYGGQG